MSEQTVADVADNGGTTTGKPRGLTYETYVRITIQKTALGVIEVW